MMRLMKLQFLVVLVLMIWYQVLEMMHRINQETLRRTWALVTLKDARLVNYDLRYLWSLHREEQVVVGHGLRMPC
uniref:Secreted protein n=1 Tax=Helianthus annuus TaxID=4232 RepID=A0A251V5E9_HELAN